MITRYFLAVFLFLFCACKTTRHTAAARQTVAAPAPASSPMSCRIEAEILSESKAPGNDTTSICAKYPCIATVRIISLSGCGSSVSVSFNENDTATVNFAYTLHSTAKIFPSMPTKFPGLKTGDHFSATVFQHMQPGTDGNLTVYDYEVIKK